MNTLKQCCTSEYLLGQNQQVPLSTNEWFEEALALMAESFEETRALLRESFGPSAVVGMRFNPTDQSLIHSYLWRKVNNMVLPNNLILDLNIYETDPSSIQFDDTRFLKGERYFFVEREAISKNQNGKRPRRTVTTQNDVGGYWHANTGDKNITLDDDDDLVIGYKKSLTFFQYQNPNDNNNHPKIAKKGDYIMHEYRMATDKFERWVLCRIKKISRPKSNEGVEEKSRINNVIIN